MLQDTAPVIEMSWNMTEITDLGDDPQVFLSQAAKRAEVSMRNAIAELNNSMKEATVVEIKM